MSLSSSVSLTYRPLIRKYSGKLGVVALVTSLTPCPLIAFTMSKHAVGKKALAESIAAFANSQNIVVSGAFCERLSDHVRDHIITSLKETGRFGLNGLGSLNVVDRKARQGVNPRTGEKVRLRSPAYSLFDCLLH